MKNEETISYPNLLWLAYSSAPVDQFNDSKIPCLPEAIQDLKEIPGLPWGDSATAYTNLVE